MQVRDQTQINNFILTSVAEYARGRKEGPYYHEPKHPKFEIGHADNKCLLKFGNRLYQNKGKVHFKIVYESGAYVYGNNLIELAELFDDTCALVTNIRESVVTRPRDSFVCRHSLHNLRSYFKEQRINSKIKSSITTYFRTQDTKTITLSKSMSEFLDSPQQLWIERHYFFDYTNASILNMLEFAYPNLIRETMIKHKVNS